MGLSRMTRLDELEYEHSLWLSLLSVIQPIVADYHEC